MHVSCIYGEANWDDSQSLYAAMETYTESSSGTSVRVPVATARSVTCFQPTVDTPDVE